MTVYAHLEEHCLDPAAELENLMRKTSGDGAVVRQTSWRLMRGVPNLPDSVFEGWNGLLEGLLAVHDRFLVLDVRRRLDRGDDAFEWEIRPRGPAGAY